MDLEGLVQQLSTSERPDALDDDDEDNEDDDEEVGEKGFPSSADSWDSESEEEVLDEEDRMPAGSIVERVEAPFHIRQLYTIVDLVRDSGVGRQVRICERPTGAKRLPFAEWLKLNGGIATGKDQISRCILKTWKKNSRPSEETEKWLSTQLQLLKMERHPNILLPRRIMQDETSFHVEFDAILTGNSLLHMVINEPSMTERQVRRITRELLEGLGHLHEHGLAHKDLKPENVIMEWFNADRFLRTGKPPDAWKSVKQAVQQWQQSSSFRSSWTRHDMHRHVRIIDLDTVGPGTSRVVCGSPGYMAPEAYLGYTGPFSDLFSVGVILYLLVKCEAPLHDAVFSTMGNKTLEESTLALRKKVSASVDKCLNSIDWDGHPWARLSVAANLCATLLHTDHSQRGTRASLVVSTHLWFRTHDDAGQEGGEQDAASVADADAGAAADVEQDATEEVPASRATGEEPE